MNDGGKAKVVLSVLPGKKKKKENKYLFKKKKKKFLRSCSTINKSKGLSCRKVVRG